MAARFLIPPALWHDDILELPAEERYHARRVLRLKEGDVVVVFDGHGRECSAVIETLRRNEGQLRLIAEAPPPASASTVRLVTIQGLPKGRKMDEITEDLTELGVHVIIPVIAARSVSRPPAERAEAQAQRWRRRSVEAAKQCRRATLPEIIPPTSLQEALNRFAAADDALGLIAWVGHEGDGHLDATLSGPPPAQVWMAIGPEGGWSDQEARAAIEAGFMPVSLGPRVLRTETAGPALAAIIGSRWGDLRTGGHS